MEFTPELFDKTSKMLIDHKGFIEKGMILELFKVTDCQVIFARKNLEILSFGKLALYKNTNNDTGFASYVVFKKEGKTVNLLNVHGKARPGHKFDTPARIRQSKKIINFFSDKSGPKIIGGDFNLELNTKSVRMFEEAGYRNLIKDYKIDNTRNRISWENYKDSPGFVKQYFADYVFVSPEIKVKNFEVPNIEVSDHLPLILEFSLDSARD